MMAQNIVVLGASGMLGSMLVDYLSRNENFAVSGTVRSQALARLGKAQLPSVHWLPFDAEAEGMDSALNVLDGHRWVVNAIGITKPLIKENVSSDVERAIRINSMLPYAIAAKSAACGAQVLQIATDCVFSGAKGNYLESAPHDPLDVYGKTKSLGEVAAPHVHHIRTSIIGPEPKEHKFLLDWFLGQAEGAMVSGYTNQVWNGVGTLQFAQVCEGIVKTNLPLPNLVHLIPQGMLTKAEMLDCFAESYGRTDIRINRVQATTFVDRTLATTQEDLNHVLWDAAGYDRPPTLAEMIADMARYTLRLHAE